MRKAPRRIARSLLATVALIVPLGASLALAEGASNRAASVSGVHGRKATHRIGLAQARRVWPPLRRHHNGTGGGSPGRGVEEAGAPGGEPEAEPPPPSEPPRACTSVVDSVAAAEAAVSAAAPGSVVCLADGTYGRVALDATKAEPGVILQAESPGRASIDGATMRGSHLTLARFAVGDEIVVEPGSAGMTVAHNRISGGYFGVLAGPTTTTTVNDVSIVGNSFVGPFGEDAIRANRYHDANGDGAGLLVEGNEFTKVIENGNHSDCLQTVWTGDHLVYRHNYLHDNRCQGFFVKDQTALPGGVSGPVEGIRVEDNLFLHNTEPCAPSAPGCGQPNYAQIFGPYSALVIAHNTIWGNGSSSLLTLREGVPADTRIEANAIYRFWTDTDASAAGFAFNTYCKLEGSWPSSRPGSTVECSPPFADPGAGDYRLPSGRGVSWDPAEQHYGP